MNEEDYTLWEKHTIDLHENDEFISINYWYLHEFSCKLVLRNKKWFHDNIRAIKETWDIIEHDRINGYTKIPSLLFYYTSRSTSA